jgi:hypothetical protein
MQKSNQPVGVAADDRPAQVVGSIVGLQLRWCTESTYCEPALPSNSTIRAHVGSVQSTAAESLIPMFRQTSLRLSEFARSEAAAIGVLRSEAGEQDALDHINTIGATRFGKLVFDRCWPLTPHQAASGTDAT